LLILVTFCSLLMTAMVTWSGLAALALLLATLVVGLHLLSTAIGSHLRNHSDRVHPREPRQETPSPVAFNVTDQTSPGSQIRSPWHERRSTPLPWLPRLVISASFVGGMVGALVLDGRAGDRASTAGVAVGSISLAVVAGWFAFAGYSFCGVFRHGLRDAMSNDHPDRPR
jgi:hypothetical protein